MCIYVDRVPCKGATNSTLCFLGLVPSLMSLQHCCTMQTIVRNANRLFLILYETYPAIELST